MTLEKYKINLNPSAKLILIKFQGKIYYTDMLELMHKILSSENYNPNCNILLDYRNASSIWFRLEVVDFVREFKKLVSFTGKKKYAYIVDTPNQKYSIPIFKSLVNMSNLNVKYFNNCDESLDWLGIDESDREWINEFLEHKVNR